jgi:hypothetical protein
MYLYSGCDQGAEQMPMWVGEIVISSVAIILALFSMSMSDSFRSADLNPADVGPAAFPVLVSCSIILFGGLHIAFTLKKRLDTQVQLEGPVPLIAGMVLSFFYLYSMPMIGYFWATPVWIILIMIVLGNHKWMQILIISGSLTVFAYFVFYKFLRVMLPT